MTGAPPRWETDLPEDLLHPIYTAYHESGHAVLELLTGYRFRYVTIRARRPGALGIVIPHRPRVLPAHDGALHEAGGPAAEMYFRALAACGEDDDPRLVASLSLTDGYFDGYPELVSAENLAPGSSVRALDIVVEHWAAVTAVAEALLSAPRRLTWRDAAAVAQPHFTEPIPSRPRRY